MLSDNLTQIILAVVAIIGTTINLVLVAVLNDKHKQNYRLIQEVKSTKNPSMDDVVALYATAEKTLDAMNKLLRKHGRTVQAKAERAANEDLDEVREDQLPMFPTGKSGLRRIRKKLS